MNDIKHVDRLPEEDAGGQPSASPLVIHWANQVCDKLDEIIDRFNDITRNKESESGREPMGAAGR